MLSLASLHEAESVCKQPMQSSKVHRPRARLERVSVHVCFQKTPSCLLRARPSFRSFALPCSDFSDSCYASWGIDRALGSTDPNEPLCRGVIDAENENPDFNG